MGLFKNPFKAPEGWELALTEADIAEMEKQGYDMAPVLAVRAAAAEKDAAVDNAFAEKRKATAVPTDVTKLAPYYGTPRTTETDFFRDVAGKAPLFGKDKWQSKVANAPLVFGAVVQANSDLWLPGKESFLPAVFVFALDSAHIHDVEWLTATAKAVAEMKTQSSVPADCQEFMSILKDDQSEFCFPLGASLAPGADAWCVTYKFEHQTSLPGSRLPEDGIVPFLLDEAPKKQIPISLRQIPSQYYKA